MSSRVLRIIVCATALSLLISTAEAGQLTVAWDTSFEPEVAGYVVSFGTSPGVYEQSVDAGLGTSVTLNGLAPGRTYYVAVQAYTTEGVRSDYSAEVSGIVPPDSAPHVQVDTPAAGTSVAQPFTIAGWAVDSYAQLTTGIDAIHVYAYPEAGGAPVFVGVGQYGLSRPDLAAAFGSRFLTSGFSLEINGLAPGAYRLVVFGRSEITGVFQSSAPVPVTVVAAAPSRPVVVIDGPAPGAIVGTRFVIAGWAADLAAAGSPGVDAIHVWAYPDSGQPIFAGAANVGQTRPDVAAAFEARLLNSGFSLTVAALPVGNYTLAVYPHSTITGSFGAAVLVRIRVSNPVTRPSMTIDGPTNGAQVMRAFTVGGWAIDAGAAVGSGVDAVHVWAFPVMGGNPVFVGVAGYGTARPDVGALVGTRFTNCGYVLSAGLTAGVYDLVAYAHSTVTGSFNNEASVRITVR